MQNTFRKGVRPTSITPNWRSALFKSLGSVIFWVMVHSKSWRALYYAVGAFRRLDCLRVTEQIRLHFGRRRQWRAVISIPWYWSDRCYQSSVDMTLATSTNQIIQLMISGSHNNVSGDSRIYWRCSVVKKSGIWWYQFASNGLPGEIGICPLPCWKISSSPCNQPMFSKNHPSSGPNLQAVTPPYRRISL